MKLYNIYLIKKTFSYFLITLITLILLIWFTKAASFIRYITEKGIDISDFLNLFILILPWLLLIIIPISLFIAIIISYNQMLSHNEMVIFKNSGLTNIQLAKPAFNLALILCLICYFISFFLMPFSNKKLRMAKVDFMNNYVNLSISPGIFESLNDLTIYVRNRDSENKLFGVLVHDNRNPKYANTITAQSGILNYDNIQDNSLLLYLEDGSVQRTYYRNKKTDILYFDSYVVNLNDSSYETGKVIWKANERYLNELLNPKHDLMEKEVRDYYIEVHERFIYPLLSPILALIATAIILGARFTRYGNLFHSLSVVFTATIFIGIFMLLLNVVENNKEFTSLIYINLMIFIIFSLYKLKRH